MSSSASPVFIHQWSGPRSLSTASMYSWHARGDCTCFDEPLYAHHLAANPGLARPYKEALMQAQSADGPTVVAEVLTKAPATPLAFFKHLAKQTVHMDMSWAAADSARHVVLIRDPFRQLTSWAAADFIEHTSLDELSLPQLVALHSDLSFRCATPPVVVDADDLATRPEATLRALCGALGVEFTDKMLSWPAGPKPCDGLWAPYWYAGAHKSTGFAAPARSLRSLRPEHYSLLRAALPFYDYLKGLAIRPEGEGAPMPGQVLDHGIPRSLRPDPRNECLLTWVGPPGAGRLLPRQAAHVSAFDSAVQGGDAVWEGLRVYRGRVFKLRRHLRRLFDSARAMDFKRVHSESEITEAIFQTLAANGMRDGAHIRLTLTRGEKTTSSMNPAFNVYGCTLIVLAEWKPVVGVATYDNQKGVALVTAANRRNPPQCVDSKIHHNNLINNILPKIQANLAGAADALMLDLDGFVSETNATNVFMAKGGALLTPHADHCLPGITRETVMALAQSLGMPVVERRVSLAEFHAADEVFTTGTMGELTPVVRIDGREIGDGAVGPLTRRLQEAYAALPDEDHPDTVVLPDF